VALSQTTSNSNLDYTIVMGSSRRSKWIYYFSTLEFVCARYEKDNIDDVIMGPTAAGPLAGRPACIARAGAREAAPPGHAALRCWLPAEPQARVGAGAGADRPEIGGDRW
jgi:hypothetical protein